MLFIGNHGTSEECAESILKIGFIPSKGVKHWFGRGVYFFIDGINIPKIEELAELWAKDQSYNQETKSFNYNRFAVLKASIKGEEENTADLRIDEVTKRVNAAREHVKRMCTETGKRMTDDNLWLYMEKKFGIKAIISNTYIKFGDERRKRIESRVNNCTIMSVLDEGLIDRASIQIIKIGDI